MDLILIRHARPVRVDAADGPADPSLSAEGCAQAAALARWLGTEPIDQVVTSPLRRAVETARPLAAALAVDAEVVPDLAEFDAGHSAYVPLEDIKSEGGDTLRAIAEGRWEAFGLTDLDAFSHKAVGVIEEVIARHPGRRVAAVCHGGVINVYLAHVLGLSPKFFFAPDYVSVSRLTASRTGRRTIVSLNETLHQPKNRRQNHGPS